MFTIIYVKTGVVKEEEKIGEASEISKKKTIPSRQIVEASHICEDMTTPSRQTGEASHVCEDMTTPSFENEIV